jgi:hypothetical protein
LILAVLRDALDGALSEQLVPRLSRVRHKGAK